MVFGTHCASDYCAVIIALAVVAVKASFRRPAANTAEAGPEGYATSGVRVGSVLRSFGNLVPEPTARIGNKAPDTPEHPLAAGWEESPALSPNTTLQQVGTRALSFML